jgi:ABC-type polysaccharide/polyol phosphate transport system ATPase subunit
LETAALPAVSFEGVGKRFKMSPEQPRTVLETVIALVRLQRRQTQELWAVRDLSFDLYRGESLGIIGRNGSGKSTALKLIARILRPTQGRITVRGRVSALLELGAGFHPDLTGRENIYLNGSILGLQQSEIDARFPAIVDFSELHDFIDIPVKHYSSGMYMRLGFSIAIHVQPDILIVDEILAVGDQAFQAKCFDRIAALQQAGTTIILVSHNMDMVQKVCTRLLWLEHGRLRKAGLTHEVLGAYTSESYRRPAPADGSLQRPAFQRKGTQEVQITGVRLCDREGQATTRFRTNEPMTVEMSYAAHKAVHNPEFGLAFFRQDGIQVNGPNTRLAGVEMGWVQGTGVVRYQIARLPLLPARYELTVAVHDSRQPVAYDYHDHAYQFEVLGGGTPEIDGLVAFPAQWEWAGGAELVKASTAGQVDS